MKYKNNHTAFAPNALANVNTDVPVIFDGRVVGRAKVKASETGSLVCDIDFRVDSEEYKKIIKRLEDESFGLAKGGKVFAFSVASRIIDEEV